MTRRTADGVPVVLIHRFPDGPRAYDGTLYGSGPGLPCAGPLAARLRADALSRCGDAAAGQQAAMGADLLEFMNALGLGPARARRLRLGRARRVHRRRCARTLPRARHGRRLQHPEHGDAGAAGLGEGGVSYWYQWYFNTERGRAGLEQNRRDICRLCGRNGRRPGDSSRRRSSVPPRFDNPDFVAVVIHSYRHRHGAAPGDRRWSDRAAPRRAAGDHRAHRRPSRRRRHRALPSDRRGRDTGRFLGPYETSRRTERRALAAPRSSRFHCRRSEGAARLRDA